VSQPTTKSHIEQVWEWLRNDLPNQTTNYLLWWNTNWNALYRSQLELGRPETVRIGVIMEDECNTQKQCFMSLGTNLPRAVGRQLHSYNGPPAFHICFTITCSFYIIYILSVLWRLEIEFYSLFYQQSAMCNWIATKNYMLQHDCNIRHCTIILC